MRRKRRQARAGWWGGCLKGSNRWMGRDHEGTWEGCRADTKSSESGFLKDFCKFTVWSGLRGLWGEEYKESQRESKGWGGGGVWRVGEALTGPEVKSAIWCFRKGADWVLIQCKENDKQAFVVVYGGGGTGSSLGGLFCLPRWVKLCEGYCWQLMKLGELSDTGD